MKLSQRLRVLLGGAAGDAPSELGQLQPETGELVTRDEIAAIYRTLLGADPPQAVVEGFLARRCDIATVLSQVLRMRGGDDRTAVDTTDIPPPPTPIPVMVPARYPPVPSERRVAVFLRSHVVDEKFHDIWRALSGSRRLYDVFLLLDQAAIGSQKQAIDNTYPGVIWYHPGQMPAMGLHQRSGDSNIYWLCGDISLFTALLTEPQFDYYVMIDYDVHFCKNAKDYLNGLTQKLRDIEDMPDGLGLEYRSAPTVPAIAGAWPGYVGWEFFAAAHRVFPEVFHFYFPIVALSRRAILCVLAQRQLESLRRTPAEDVVNAEAFVPSCLMAAGMKCMDLNEFIPGSYKPDSMGLQHLRSDRVSGQPLSYAASHPPDGVEMIHAVYSQRRFLERNLTQRGNDHKQLEWLIGEIEQNFASSLDSDVLEAFLERARKRLEAL